MSTKIRMKGVLLNRVRELEAHRQLLRDVLRRVCNEYEKDRLNVGDPALLVEARGALVISVDHPETWIQEKSDAGR